MGDCNTKQQPKIKDQKTVKISQANVAALAQQSEAYKDIPACRTMRDSRIDSLDSDDYTKFTLYDAFLKGHQVAENKPCMGWRSSEKTGFDNWLTYAETLERVTHIGNGLRWIGQQPSNDTFIGMFSKNRAEMMLTQLACYQHSMVIVPMYDTLGDEAMEHIINQTEMQVVVCENEQKIDLLLKVSESKGKIGQISHVIHMEPISADHIEKLKQRGVTCHSMADLEKEGRHHEVEQVLCKPDDLCMICYTSGTTGTPKGAMIRHRNLYASIVDVEVYMTKTMGCQFFIPGEEVLLSYLPLAHAYEQLVEHLLFMLGGRIGYYSGDVKQLLGDIGHLRPTLFGSVPRLLTRIYDKVMATVNTSSIKSFLLKTALNKKEAYYRRGIITKDTIWDKLAFKRLQTMFGGRVKFMSTGAAPIASPVLRFFRLALGAVVIEGYGQTESAAVMTTTMPGDYVSGEVGVPIPSLMVKLVDVPEMNYLAADNRGEVCCYGAGVFKGYLKEEAKTKEALDEDGWLHTGDIGVWTERGTLKIIDRKKHIFKLAQGEYVAPEKIENVYGTNPLVAQCFVHGESLKASLVAVVVPDTDVLPNYAASKLGIKNDSMEQLCANPKVKKAILEGMRATGTDGGLKGFEQVRDIHVCAEPFSIENNLLTPTFKLKRVDCRTVFRQAIDEMYEKLE